MEEEAMLLSGNGTPARRARRGRLVFLAAVVVMATGVVAALLVDSGERDPGDQLDAVLAYADAHETATFTLDIEHRFSSGSDGLGQTGTSRERGDGVLRLPDSSRAVWRNGEFTGESIQLPGGSYNRFAEGDDLSGEQWTYTSAEELAEMEEEVYTAEDAEYLAESMVGGAATASIGAAAGALSALGTPPDLVDALRDVERVERVDGDTVRAEIDPASLLPADVVSELREQLSFEIAVEVTSGPDDRLDEVVFAERAEPVASTDDDDDADSAFTGTSTSTITLRFADWGKPVAIEAPSSDQVDPTPGIDEDDLSSVTAFRVLTVGTLPPGWMLTSAWRDEADEELEMCESVSLSYGDPTAEPTEGPDGEEVYPPDLTVTTSSAACEWREEPEGETVAVGGREAVVSEGDDFDGYQYTDVSLTIDGTHVVVSSDLPRDEVVRLAATIVPLDLASQPIHREVPPA